MPTCPKCSHHWVAPRKVSVADRKLAEDLAKARAAIVACRRWLTVNLFNERGLQREPIQDEIIRLTRALEDHTLLARIFRRNDKGDSYVSAS